MPTFREKPKPPHFKVNLHNFFKCLAETTCLTILLEYFVKCADLVALKNKAYPAQFKKAQENEDLETVAESALKQIEEKKYSAELQNRGISRILTLGIVFQGKRVLVKEGHPRDA